MATYETSLSNTSTGKVVGVGSHRTSIEIPAIVALSTAMIDNANDDVGLFNVPAGFVVTGIGVDVTDMDSGSAGLIDIGDVDDEDRLIAALSIQAVGYTTALARAGFLYKYTAKTQIRVYCNTAAGTAVAGTLKVCLKGFIDENFSTTALTPA